MYIYVEIDADGNLRLLNRFASRMTIFLSFFCLLIVNQCTTVRDYHIHTDVRALFQQRE